MRPPLRFPDNVHDDRANRCFCGRDLGDDVDSVILHIPCHHHDRIAVEICLECAASFLEQLREVRL